MHGGQRQQAGDGSVILVHSAVGKNQQRVPGFSRERRSLAQLVKRPLQSRFPFAGTEQRGQGDGQQIPGRYAAQFFQVDVGQKRVRQLQHVTVLGFFREYVALGSDVTDERHNDLFANRVDGRIGDLCEELLKVIEQRLGPVPRDKRAAYPCPSSPPAPR